MTAQEFTSNWIKEHGLPIETSTSLLEKTIVKIVQEYYEQQVKSVDLAAVVGSLPAFSADFENIIGRSFPIKDSEPSEYFETLKHAGNECAEWVHHKIKVFGQ